MASEFQREVATTIFKDIVHNACEQGLDKLPNTASVSQKNRETVNKLLCDTLMLTGELVINGGIKNPVDIGIYFIQRGIDLDKLSKDERVLCDAAVRQIVVNTTKVGITTFATFKFAVVGARVGGVAGALAAAVATTKLGAVKGGKVGIVGGPKGVVVGAVVGAVVGTAAPLAFAAYQYYQEIPQIMTEAVYVHSQCGPLSIRNVPRSRAPQIGKLFS
jgi:hypothetical protein